MKDSILCTVPDTYRAELALGDLRYAGFLAEEVSVLFPDRGATQANAARGGSLGGALDGALGWMVGIGGLIVPGAGSFVVAGPLVAWLGPALVAGGIAQALMSLGLPEDEARSHELGLRDGRVLLAVQAGDERRATLAREVLVRNGAEDIALARRPAGGSPPAS